MIKLIGIFDKALQKISWDSSDGIEELLIDEMAGVDTDCIPCPKCESHRVKWRFYRCRKHSLVWDDPSNMVRVPLPEYTYCCDACGSTGYEMFSPDISIHGTQLSYHYLFRLLREVFYTQEMNVVDRENLLYGRLSEESLKAWKMRFRRDFSIVKLCSESIDEHAFLSEQVSYGAIFQRFFEVERRFFLHEAQTDLVLFARF